ncbi:MAG: SRPBCC domain-containing protein [Chitinophagaceae bacterium]|nr:SRPBCC domain-containing protein [Chitinophagaceae bacterium]
MPDINHAVLIGAAAEHVYAAITTPQGLSAWWTPGTNAKAETNTVAHFPFGPGYFKEMIITELKPFSSVKWNCIKGADEWVGTNISFTLIPGDKEMLLKSYPEILGQIEQLKNDNGTLLIFHHDDWKEHTLMFAECSYTWGQFLRSLKLFCETGKGKPWPQQHCA